MAFSENRASRYTRIGANQTDSVIVDGSTCTIYGIVCTNVDSSAATVTIEEYNSSVVIETIRVSGDSTFESSIQWLADKGLQITTPANVSVTVFHSQPGS